MVISLFSVSAQAEALFWLCDQAGSVPNIGLYTHSNVFSSEQQVSAEGYAKVVVEQIPQFYPNFAPRCYSSDSLEVIHKYLDEMKKMAQRYNLQTVLIKFP